MPTLKVPDEERAKIKSAAHSYANPKTKVLKTYTRLFDAFQAGALWAIAKTNSKEIDPSKVIIKPPVWVKEL